MVVLLVWPLGDKEPAPADNSDLQEAVARFGAGIIGHEDARRDSFRRQHQRQWDSSVSHRFSSSYERPPKVRFYDTLMVDISTADSSRLCQLYGIGPSYAKRIVKYRSLLGGFVNVNQLREVFGMDDERFLAIAPNVFASAKNVSRIPVNSATVDELRRHPYIDFYQARAIVEYRSKAGPLKNYDDLLKVNLIDDSLAIKIIGYIQFN